MAIYYGQELYHHGIEGQKWGERRYQNEDGSLTPEGREHYGYGKAREKLTKAEKAYTKAKNSTSFFSKERSQARATYKAAKKEYKNTTKTMDRDISNTKKQLEQDWENKHKREYATAKMLSNIYNDRSKRAESTEDETGDNLLTITSRYEKERADNNLSALEAERDKKVANQLIKTYGQDTIDEYNSREGGKAVDTLLAMAGGLAIGTLALAYSSGDTTNK